MNVARGLRASVNRDAAPEPFVGSRGKGVQPRTIEVLDGLGVAGRLVSCGRFRLPVRRYDGAGGHTDQDLHPGAEPTPDTPYARGLMIPEWRVEEILRERLADDDVRVQWSRRVTGLVQHHDQVAVDFADRPSLTARYVIGADGGHHTRRGRAR